MDRHPSLCRICEFPALDTGVQVSRLDLDKLSSWWMRTFETEMDDDAETLTKSWICQFCLCDASFQAEKQEDDYDSCDWWTQHIDRFYKEFYSRDEVIRPCYVSITPLQTKDDISGKLNLVRNNKMKETACVHCGEVFRSIRSAHSHVMSKHKDVPTHTCKTCVRHFKCAEDLRLHKESCLFTHIKCHYCREKLKNLVQVWIHLRDSHSEPGQSENTVQCCGSTFRGLSKLSVHLNKNAFRKVNCIYCNKSLRQSYMSDHVKRLHSSVSHQCQFRLCDKYFVTLDELNLHMKMHKSNSGRVPCIYCGKEIKLVTLDQHVFKLHHNISIRCTQNRCRSFFRSETERDQHVLECHKYTRTPGVRQEIECVCCGKKLSSLETFIEHMKTIHATEMARCPSQGCYNFFKSKAELDEHFLRHHAEQESAKIFHCETCSFRAKTLSHLREHISALHCSGNFQCDECPRFCESLTTLREHKKRMHSDRGVCPYCNENKNVITRHLIVLPCRKCNSSMPCKKLARLHQKNCVKEKYAK